MKGLKAKWIGGDVGFGLEIPEDLSVGHCELVDAARALAGDNWGLVDGFPGNWPKAFVGRLAGLRGLSRLNLAIEFLQMEVERVREIRDDVPRLIFLKAEDWQPSIAYNLQRAGVWIFIPGRVSTDWAGEWPAGWGFMLEIRDGAVLLKTIRQEPEQVRNRPFEAQERFEAAFGDWPRVGVDEFVAAAKSLCHGR